MLTSKSFGVDYDDADPAEIRAAGFDLVVVSTNPLKSQETPSLTDAEVRDLQADGVRVMGYVNSSVTNHYSGYWNPAWTVDGTDNSAVTDAAPGWLRTGDSNKWGYYTNYTDAEWQQIVIDQAVDLVRRGYAGVFLDDVEYYYQGQRTGNEAQAARDMMDLVMKVKAAVTAVNPDAYVMVNAVPRIVSTAGVEHPNTRAFLEAIDGLMLENIWGMSREYYQPFLDTALNDIAPYAQLFAVETDGTPYQRYLFTEEARALGISVATSDDEVYDTPGAPISPATDGADNLLGTFRPDTIYALAGDDTVTAGEGSDTVYGGGGADLIAGNAGDDKIYGDAGADRLAGNIGNDVLDGGEGDDELYGSAGGDILMGSDGNDRLFAEQGTDELFGGIGADALDGGNDNDWIEGGGGDDRLTGGSGADGFFFDGAFGNDTVTDFEPGSAGDKLWLYAVTAITDYADLTANHMRQEGNDVVITDGAGNSIRLVGLALTELDAGNFVF
jgi:endo-alpha-1,4-polygalactosaminidase (GH114 family)